MMLTTPATAAAPDDASLWYSKPPLRQVDLYFFWSERCPHCLEARPFIESLPGQYDWIRLHALEVYYQEENRQRFVDMARLVGTSANSVPTFFWCGDTLSGWNDEQSTRRNILDNLAACYLEVYGQPPTGVESEQSGSHAGIDIPLIGNIDTDSLSLPVLTLLLAGLDAFNPCAFFVLLFLLSLLVNTRSRTRMLLVGGIFVTFSGLVYFLFMAAWLNVFTLFGQIQAITLLAGLVAVALASVNIKDYFRFRQGPSLSMSDEKRGRLFKRMRGLLDTQRLPTLIGGTVVLALAANSYELLCTAGLPMVYTRLLTLEALPVMQYYGYLAFYNLVYVTPLFIILLVFVFTLGRRKLSEGEGRLLKLLSGMLMLGLGLLLLFSPNSLGNVGVAVALFGGAILLSAIIHRLAEFLSRSRS